jgi:two-component system, OmpR family, response regulator
VSIPTTILLVEDDIVVADVLRRLLIRAGYRVRVATDGIQALAALDEALPAVLILDLILPGVSGFTILEHIRLQQLPLPIIVITANPLYHDSLHHAGIRHILIKPFQIEELLGALRSTSSSARA